MNDIICAFMILHYGDEKLTIRAVNSLKKIYDIENCKIIIVDNGSPNNSGMELKKIYSNDKLVDVQLIEQNLGFSRGNNWGFNYIKNKYRTKFIIAMNNDIIVDQKEFVLKLIENYNIYKFEVAGPDIYVPQRLWHSSPLREHVLDDTEFEEYKNHWKLLKRRFGNKCSILNIKDKINDYNQNDYIVKTIYKLWRIVRGNPSEYRKVIENCVLQGSFLIFDSKFIAANDKLFEPETFLYEEENILTERCTYNNWKIIYLPYLHVIHTCQGSTKAKRISYNEYLNKKVAETEKVIEACSIYEKYRDMIKNDKENH